MKALLQTYQVVYVSNEGNEAAHALCLLDLQKNLNGIVVKLFV